MLASRAKYLVIYDLPRSVPRWKLRDRLLKLAKERDVVWHRLQHSVLACETLRDAALVAETIYMVASETGAADSKSFSLKVLEVAREVPLFDVFARARTEQLKPDREVEAKEQAVKAACDPAEAWRRMDEEFANANPVCCSECAHFTRGQPGALANGFCSFYQAFVHDKPPRRCPHFRPRGP